MIVKMSQKDSN